MSISACIAIAAGVLVGTSSSPVVSAQDDLELPTTTEGDDGTTSTTIESGTRTRPGRVAYVSLSGEVVVAESDGSAAKVVGSGAVRNGAGLAPLAWSPDGQRVAYVRNDKSLVLASTDGSLEPLIVARNAVVPPDVSESILSFLATATASGTAIAYLAETPSGATEAGLMIFDGPEAGTYRPLSDPASRKPIAFQFSPLDPYLYLRSADIETGKEFTIAVVEPFDGTPFATPYSVDDPVFAPDGAYLYGVVRGQGLEQLVRVDTINAQFTLLRAQDRICKPMPSPDGQRLVYAAGANCNEVWTIDSNGAEPEQVTDNVGGSASFADGVFSWSLDAAIVTHASCKGLEEGAACGGAYWDIRVDGSGVKARAQASSVVREFRPLIKPIKVEVDITGPLEYQGKMLVSAEGSIANLMSNRRESLFEAKAVDQQLAERSFTVKGMIAAESRFMMGTINVVDPEAQFDQTITVVGALLVQSYRYATMRGIWFKTSSMPFQSGRIDLTLFR